jgi:hypothetical protein
LATTWPAGWRRPSRSVSAALLTLVLAGCGADSDAAKPAAGGKQRFESNGGRYTVELETSPASIAVNQPFDVTVAVTPKAGPATDLDVVVDARMPAHFHGMNRVAKISRGPGNSWKAEGLLFHMPGHWELYIDVSQGGATERAQMDVNLK